MKKQGLGLFLMSLMLIVRVDASAGKAAIEAAENEKQEASAAQAARSEIPENVIDAILRERSKDVIDWLNANPAHKDAVEAKGGGRSILMVVLIYIQKVGLNVFRHLIAMKPNVFAQDNAGEDILDYYLMYISYLPDELFKEIARPIIALMIEQEVDFKALLKRAQQRSLRSNVKSDPRRTAFFEWIIDLLHNEHDKLGLKAAKEIVVSQGCLVSDIGTLIAPSNPHLRAIKHAIEDNDEAKLKEALENNKWLEIKDQTGYTPFLYAAYIQRPNMMKYLIEQGADVHAKTKDNVGATYFGDYQKLIDDTKNAFTKASQDCFDAIKAHHKREDVLKVCKETVFNVRDDQGRTPLILAAEEGDQDIIRIFMESNDSSMQRMKEREAYLSMQDTNGNTALHAAINKGHYSAAELISVHMDKKTTELTNKNGDTARALAMKHAVEHKDNQDLQSLIAFLNEVPLE